MLNLLLLMRAGANSVPENSRWRSGGASRIDEASNGRYGRHQAAEKAKREWQSTFQMVLARSCAADLANYLWLLGIEEAAGWDGIVNFGMSEVPP